MELKTNVLYYGDNLEALGKTLRSAQGDTGGRFAQGDRRGAARHSERSEESTLSANREV